MHKPRTAHLQPTKRVALNWGPRCRTFSYGCASCEAHLFTLLTGRAPGADWMPPERTDAEFSASEMNWPTAVSTNRI